MPKAAVTDDVIRELNPCASVEPLIEVFIEKSGADQDRIVSGNVAEVSVGDVKSHAGMDLDANGEQAFPHPYVNRGLTGIGSRLVDLQGLIQGEVSLVGKITFDEEEGPVDTPVKHVDTEASGDRIMNAAHAMSPAGGVGINLAIQDAVATANLLMRPLLERCVRLSDLAAVQKRREFPTRVTQGIQLAAHRGFARLFQNPGPIRAPWQLKAAMRLPGIHRALGHAVVIGARPEQVRERVQAGAPHCRGLTAVFVGIAVTAVAAAVAWATCKAGKTSPCAIS